MTRREAGCLPHRNKLRPAMGAGRARSVTSGRWVRTRARYYSRAVFHSSAPLAPRSSHCTRCLFLDPVASPFFPPSDVLLPSILCAFRTRLTARKNGTFVVTLPSSGTLSFNYPISTAALPLGLATLFQNHNAPTCRRPVVDIPLSTPTCRVQLILFGNADDNYSNLALNMVTSSDVQ